MRSSGNADNKVVPLHRYLSLGLLLLLLLVEFDDAVAKSPKKYIGESSAGNPVECPKGLPISACKRRSLLFPYPRLGRRSDPTMLTSSPPMALFAVPRIIGTAAAAAGTAGASGNGLLLVDAPPPSLAAAAAARAAKLDSSVLPLLDYADLIDAGFPLTAYQTSAAALAAALDADQRHQQQQQQQSWQNNLMDDWIRHENGEIDAE
ncbi:uncharacterized protein LOC106650816 [Trichogramma pretiosum]|uniref:uncharacterized protein LOC106650816 n=1 Tax=Trichogramma pretiosum TaxID=7493 RepID=UPI0006C9ACCC|nr:uncharacterized protein LOC106650816 [Trichogramma pretiosum]